VLENGHTLLVADQVSGIKDVIEGSCRSRDCHKSESQRETRSKHRTSARGGSVPHHSLHLLISISKLMSAWNKSCIGNGVWGFLVWSPFSAIESALNGPDGAS